MSNNNSNARRKLQSAKYNSESKYDPYQIDFLMPSMSRVKDKIRRTATSSKRKRKYSEASLSDTMSSTSTLMPQTTIRQIVKQRHELEQSSRKIGTQFNYLSVKYEEKLKQKQFQQQKNQKISQIINQNKMYRSFVSKTICLENKNTQARKLSLKNTVISHREEKYASINKSKLERSIIGEIGRKQIQQCHKQIEQIKQEKIESNRESVSKGKKMEEMRAELRRQREQQKKQIAEQNFRRRWMKEFLRKQKAQRENKLRNKIYSKKIAELLQKTQQLRPAFSSQI